jgi:hypothetical protein
MKKNLLSRHFMVLWSCVALLLMQLTATAQTLTHRYSFYSADGDTNALDLVGTANGTFEGDLAGTAISGGELELDGSGYVQLPTGIITNDLAVTVEAWGNYPGTGEGTWANLFDFGSPSVADLPGKADSHSISCCVNTGNPTGDLDAALADFDDANVNRQNCYASAALLLGTSTPNAQPGDYIAAVFNPPLGYIALYVNGILQGKISITNTITPGVWDTTNWIGWDNWPDPSLTANLNEFRIWNGALNGLEVAASYQNGATNLDTNAGVVTSIQFTAGSQVNLGGEELSTVVATATLVTNTADVTPFASYSSGDTNIITVDTSGGIHGKTIGSTLVTASYGGQSNSVMIAVIEPVAILAHRISFSEPVSSSNTVADTVGTLYATLEGTAVETNGEVLLDGSAGCYIDLSSNSFANDGIISGYQSATVDFWATFTGLSANWEYGWSFGNDPVNYGSDFIYFSVHAGATDHYINTATSAGGAAVDMGGDFANESVHCTSIIDPTTGTLAVYTNGVLSGSITGDSSVPPLSSIATNFIFFGRSLWTDVGAPFTGDPFLSAGSSFKEIRVYNGTLTPQQIATADQLGPSSTNNDPGTLVSVTVQAPSTLEWLQSGAVKLLANYTVLTNWNLIGNSYVTPAGLTITSSDTNVVAVDGTQLQAVGVGSSTLTVTYAGTTNSQAITVVHAPPAVLTHRYSFNDPAGSAIAADSVGTLNGTFQGAAYETNGQLVLPNLEVNSAVVAPATDYLELPDGIITNAVNGIGTNFNDPTVTVEAWATILPNQYTWANLFDFGNQDGGGLAEYDIHVCVHGGDGDTIIGISDSDNANADYQDEDIPGGSHLDGSTNLHIVAVFNPPAGYLAIYTNGVMMGENPNVTISMAGVWAALNKIGADNWPDPGMQGTVDEFRIYNGVLSPDNVAATQILGPNQLLPAGGVPSVGGSVVTGNFLISWPVTGSTGFSLYSSPTIGPNAVWTLVNTTPTVVGQDNQVSVPINGSVTAQFFQLKK